MTVSIVDDKSVRHILIDRPERMNAVDKETLHRLSDAVESAGEDPMVRVIVLSGTGRAFCAGGDLDVDDPLSVENTADTSDAASRCIAAITRAPRPVVAAVRGPAVGVGVSLALAADLTAIRSDAYFSMPFTSIGLMPDGGATALVAASAGRAISMRMSLLGERLSASNAERAGLVAAAYEPEVFESELEKLTARLSGISFDSLIETKRAINDASLSELDNAFARERDGQIRLTTTDSFRDAVAVFAAKRSRAGTEVRTRSGNVDR
ncbi:MULTISPECIES: enoyl-CoA hydratase-related protein [Rhodococcus]|uniref:Enoyl-CoA hydratase-related protein n=1 Tax=Rhodococcus oxybenzonivorans TaxID=1990687 RepID=A0AAE5A9X8_9NOCA|nr:MULTISPECIES: enoyl-CoA hydratase-related protein [Rhodococcus]MDV7242679.1 enoyl-CoA hydratase-related protein [Rhodococcus oxybenzonivorans]MDV7268583.1 enoyl-CoA hydratase-related protein [Rhodococcus oxybenzonivorans]MDV7276112.1 enoyl-CoA hydratase-related protein [Rhodococcus oxybenzonivorans]MDV7332167.1 enoyl-CoA hydratase-related protein [Rhodococcus oxybenzonivorans]MDV7344372.1 enoyl-CoA hydratase-related protein [Rhodococcus oxybenzonivorans]